MISDDPALGEYRKDFANAVFLFKEREPVDATSTDNTEKTQRKGEEDNDTRVNKQIVLKARLLDLLLGDCYRHEDQWRWEKENGKKKMRLQPERTLFRPVLLTLLSAQSSLITSHQPSSISEAAAWLFTCFLMIRFWIISPVCISMKPAVICKPPISIPTTCSSCITCFMVARSLFIQYYRILDRIHNIQR